MAYPNIMLLAVFRTLANCAEITLVSPNYASYHQTYAIQQNPENRAGQITTKQGTNKYPSFTYDLHYLSAFYLWIGWASSRVARQGTPQ